MPGRSSALLRVRGTERDGRVLEEVLEVVEVCGHERPGLGWDGGGGGGEGEGGEHGGVGGWRDVGGVLQDLLEGVVDDVPSFRGAVRHVGLVQHQQCFAVHAEL